MVVAGAPWSRQDAGHTYAFDQTVAWWATQSSKHTVTRLMRIVWRTFRSIITRLRRALGVPKLPATHGQSRAQAVVHAPLNQAVRHGGLPVSSWFPS